MRKKITITLLLSVCLLTASAQNHVTDSVKHQVTDSIAHENPVMTAFTDSLNNLRASYYAHFRVWEDLDIPVPRRMRPNPDFYKLFVPPTYYTSVIDQAFGIDWQPGKKLGMTATDSLYQVLSDTIERFELPQLETKAEADRWVNNLLLKYYMQYPDRVKGNELYLADMKVFDESKVPSGPKKEQVKDYMKAENPVADNTGTDTEIVVLKPNFWKKTGAASLQFSQHGISDNWYKGGESTNALLGELKLTANYDDQQRVQFENSLEIRIGFITAPSDTVHKYKTNADLFRLQSKLGVRAIKNLYYTLAAEFKTQFFPNYKTNTNDLISNFLSPAQLDVSLGLDYKLNKKNYSFSAMGSPLSYTFVYINDKNIVNRMAFNVEEDKTVAHMFGSKITGKLDWKISKNISLNSKLDYFTTYDKVIADWENTLNFQVSRYLSTKIFFHTRFDDGVKLSEDNDSYFQFKEMLTFGLSYNW